MAELASAPTTELSRSLVTIAEHQHISVAYLEQLFLKLRRAGLVDSIRGRSGGYRLARSPASISIADILTAVAEGTEMTRCAGGHGVPCVGGKRCKTHDLWNALSNHIDEFLRDVSLHDVVVGGARLVTRQTPSSPESIERYIGKRAER